MAKVISKIDFKDLLSPGDELADGAEITLPNGEKFIYKKGDKITFELDSFAVTPEAPFGEVYIERNK